VYKTPPFFQKLRKNVPKNNLYCIFARNRLDFMQSAEQNIEITCSVLSRLHNGFLKLKLEHFNFDFRYNT